MDYLTHPYSIYAAGILLIAVAIYFFLSGFNFSSYVAKTHLMTKAERNFHFYLRQAVEGRAQIFSMVRVADIVDIKESIKGKKRLERLGKIAQKHFDFVLVDNETKILCAIELNDSSHDQKERIKRDEFLDNVMKAAGIPLIKVKATRKYDVKMLKRHLKHSLPHVFTWQEPRQLAPDEKSPA